MVYKIVWTPNAEEDFDKILNYLSVRWSIEIAFDFIQIFYHKLDLLEIMPNLGVKSEKRKTTRRILITKHNYLIYSVLGDEITLLNIFDNRQNPNNLKF